VSWGKKLPPILLLHGDADQCAPIDNAERFAEALREGGAAVELKTYEGQTHTSPLIENPMRGGRDLLQASLFPLFRVLLGPTLPGRHCIDLHHCHDGVMVCGAHSQRYFLCLMCSIFALNFLSSWLRKLSPQLADKSMKLSVNRCGWPACKACFDKVWSGCKRKHTIFHGLTALGLFCQQKGRCGLPGEGPYQRIKERVPPM